MEASRVNEGTLTERLDAEFYRPVFLRNDSMLLALPKSYTVAGVSDQVKLGYTGPIDSYYGDTGALFLTSKNLAEGKVEVGEDTERIRFEIHSGVLASTQAKAGDLLLSRTGTVGKAAVLHDAEEKYNFAAHLFAIRLKKGVDGDFLAAFFNSTPGRLQSERMQRGTIIQGLSIFDIPGMKVPVPQFSAQKYIGDKARQAERLRSITLRVSAFISSEIDGMFSDDVRNSIRSHTEIRHSRVAQTQLTDRLDSRYYSEAYVQINSLLKNEKSLNDVTLKVECGPFGGNAIADDLYEVDGLPFIRPLNLTGCIFDQSKIVRVSSTRLKQFGLKEYDGENLFFARVGTPAAAYFSGAVSISPNVIIAQGKSDSADVAYLQCFCSSVYGLLQLQQELKEGVQPTTSTDAVRGMKVFLPKPEKQIEIGNLYRSREKSRLISESLVAAAKLLVESLIERNVTEDELIHAQMRLENGEDSADRAILSRLFEGGWDATETRPLFPDLDAYYETLQMVAREQTEVAAK
jgi:type I restriction enzyme S subunit